MKEGQTGGGGGGGGEYNENAIFKIQINSLTDYYRNYILFLFF